MSPGGITYHTYATYYLPDAECSYLPNSAGDHMQYAYTCAVSACKYICSGMPNTSDRLLYSNAPMPYSTSNDMPNAYTCSMPTPHGSVPSSDKYLSDTDRYMPDNCTSPVHYAIRNDLPHAHTCFLPDTDQHMSYTNGALPDQYINLPYA